MLKVSRLNPRLVQVLLFPLALALSLGLFAGLGWIIQTPGDASLAEKNPRLGLNWVKVTGDTSLETLKPPPPPPPPPPPSAEVPTASTASSRNNLVSSLAADALSLPVPSMDGSLYTVTPSLNNLGIDASADLPVYREAPAYPRQAMARRQEGWVELVFEVDAQGRVIPETIRIIAAQPQHLFDRSAIRAISRWRFAAFELGHGQNRQLKQRLEFRLEG